MCWGGEVRCGKCWGTVWKSVLGCGGRCGEVLGEVWKVCWGVER